MPGARISRRLKLLSTVYADQIRPRLSGSFGSVEGCLIIIQVGLRQSMVLYEIFCQSVVWPGLELLEEGIQWLKIELTPPF